MTDEQRKQVEDNYKRLTFLLNRTPTAPFMTAAEQEYAMQVRYGGVRWEDLLPWVHDQPVGST